MAIHLSVTDFVGKKYSIPDAASNLSTDAVQEAIDNYEKPALEKLLGVDQAALYIAYVQAVGPPANPDYNKIRDPFSADDPTCKDGIRVSLGIKEYLKAAVFFEYRKNGLVNAHAGVVNLKAETADKTIPKDTLRYAEFMFNERLSTADAIQWYCKQNPAAFPVYNGQPIKVKCANFL